MALVLGAAEIMALEQFRRQDQLRAPPGGIAHQVGDGGDILLDAVGEGELEGRDGQLRHE
jgi:hypothetical protein